MNGTWTTVAIPTLGESELLGPLLWDLASAPCADEIIVMNNRQDGVRPFSDDLLDLCVKEWKYPAWPLYQMWNMAWAHATVGGRGGPSQVVLLNDDIKIPQDFVCRLVKALRHSDDCWCAYPNYRLSLDQDEPNRVEELGEAFAYTPTKRTYKDGGLWGCAFALRGEILNDPIPPIDEQFKVWCGDDDLVRQLEIAEHPAYRVNGLAIEHHASTTLNKHPELQKVCWEDVERFKQKYGSW